MVQIASRSETPVILVTGANGFIGAALCQALSAYGYRVRGAVRHSRPTHAAHGTDLVESQKTLDPVTPIPAFPPQGGRSDFPSPSTGEKILPSPLMGEGWGGGVSSVEMLPVGDIGPATDWQAACLNVDCVVHLAARTHVLRESGARPLAEYRRVNVEGTKRLAQTAARCGVRRFVFVSSIKVNGELTTLHPFTEGDPPRPEDAYGISKWEAEQALWQIAGESGMEAVVLRPPLVYGPGVKGNLLQLLRAVARGWPLPLASIRNRRSLVFVGNLVDAILVSAQSPKAPGNTYLISDGEDVSTPDLARTLGRALGVSARLFSCPSVLLKFGAAVTGRVAAVSRLTGSLQVDSSKIRRELAWQPRYTVNEGIAQMAHWYRDLMGDG